MSTRSPGLAPAAAARRSVRSSPRNLPIGLFTAPVSSTATWARPLAPNRWASSTSSSISRRLAPAIPGTAIALDQAAAGERVVEHPEARCRPAVGVRQRGREIRELHAEAEVGLVGPEAVHRLRVGDPREGQVLDRPIRHDLARDLDDHRLHEGHHRGLVDEAHLEVELGELGLPVAPEVLVAEAPRDLVVAVDPRDHQELLELLRALGQRVDLAGPEAARARGSRGRPRASPSRGRGSRPR